MRLGLLKLRLKLSSLKLEFCLIILFIAGMCVAGAFSNGCAAQGASNQGASVKPVTTSVKIGTFEFKKPVFNAFAGAVNGSAYFTLFQHADESDALISASSDASERVEIHDHIVDQTTKIMRMVEIKEIKIPGKKEGCVFIGCWFAEPKRVKFKPGGKHLMLMGLKPGASAMNEITITLVFKNAGKVPVIFKKKKS